jgi:hypothetical protein
MGDRRVQGRSAISGPVTLSQNTTVVFRLGAIAIAIGSVTDGVRWIAVRDGGGSVSTESRQSAEFTEANSGSLLVLGTTGLAVTLPVRSRPLGKSAAGDVVNFWGHGLERAVERWCGVVHFGDNLGCNDEREVLTCKILNFLAFYLVSLELDSQPAGSNLNRGQRIAT